MISAVSRLTHDPDADSSRTVNATQSVATEYRNITPGYLAFGTWRLNRESRYTLLRKHDFSMEKKLKLLINRYS